MSPFRRIFRSVGSLVFRACENLLCGQPLFLLARRAVVLSNGVLDEVADQVEDTGIGRMLSTPGSGYSLRCVQD